MRFHTDLYFKNACGNATSMILRRLVHLHLCVVLVACFGNPSLRAETVFPSDVNLVRAAKTSTGVIYVVGQKGSRGYLAQISDSNSPPVEIAILMPEAESTALVSIAIGDDGSTYIAGTAYSRQKVFAFAQKYDTEAVRQYSVELTAGINAATNARSIAVNTRGEALVNGEVFGTGFPTTPGAPNAEPPAFSPVQRTTGFLVKLDARGKVLVAARGVGSGVAAYDQDGNLYIAGTLAGIETTPGAFQRDHALQACEGSGSFGFACRYQHVTKLSPDGLRVLYSTFVAGKFGATTAALAVTGAGEAIISGTTNSSDYPTTPDAFLPTYIASAVRRRGPGRPGGGPPPSSGFITKLNADGSGLVWSTFFSGTGAETISDAKVLSDGRIVIAGFTASGDLPGLSGVPQGCSPMIGRTLPFFSILTGDGTELLSTVVPWSIVSQTARAPLAGQADLRVTEGPGSSLVLTSVANSYLRYDPAKLQEPGVCLTDPADWTLSGLISPGQLVSIFGKELDSAIVRFGGLVSRILYSGKDQINVQVPFELVPGQDVTVEIETARRVSEQRILVAKSTPSAFLAQIAFDTTPGVECRLGATNSGYDPVAVSSDGTRYQATTGVPAGSIITLFLNGLGKEPVLSNMSADAILSLELDPNYLFWRLRVRIEGSTFLNSFDPSFGGSKLRFGPLDICVAR